MCVSLLVVFETGGLLLVETGGLLLVVTGGLFVFVVAVWVDVLLKHLEFKSRSGYEVQVWA